jgi:hypothetical protein
MKEISAWAERASPANHQATSSLVNNAGTLVQQVEFSDDRVVTDVISHVVEALVRGRARVAWRRRRTSSVIMSVGR